MLLDQLPEVESRLVEQYLQAISLRPNERLVEKERPISQIYFLDEGWASVMSTGSVRPVEVAMIGPEGMVGISVFLGATLAVNNCLMQTNGKGRRIATGDFQRILPEMPILRQRITAYVHDRLLQSYNAVVATTVGSLEARVSRAILMCHDRSASDEITITQDQLARKIGANRAGVTNVLHLLEGQRVIASRRRCILIIDRARLEKAAAGTYARSAPH
ncbi:MAG: Crp/Fnr family transcriptional regulator [Bradyrhizobium sp.]|nr:Crp/Fnr family transcriptional regulator [Bradyrhizobium sp.]